MGNPTGLPHKNDFNSILVFKYLSIHHAFLQSIFSIFVEVSLKTGK